MKKLLFSISVLWVIIVCVTSCGGKGNKDGLPLSSACEIISFKVGDKAWDISGLNITATYPKGTNVNNLLPAIVVSDKASINPKSGVAQDFSNNRAVSYTVTAEDGKSSKTYTAQLTVSASN